MHLYFQPLICSQVTGATAPLESPTLPSPANISNFLLGDHTAFQGQLVDRLLDNGLTVHKYNAVSLPLSY